MLEEKFKLSRYLFKDINIAYLITRSLLGITFFVMLISYNDFLPSFFDQFSIANQAEYLFKIPGSLFISIFFDWFGFLSFLIPPFLLFVRFNKAGPYKSIYFSILIIFCVCVIGSSFVQDDLLKVRLFGAMGYSASTLLGLQIYLKILGLAVTIGGLLLILLNIRFYSGLVFLLARSAKFLFFALKFYASKIFKQSKNIKKDSQFLEATELKLDTKPPKYAQFVDKHDGKELDNQNKGYDESEELVEFFKYLKNSKK